VPNCNASGDATFIYEWIENSAHFAPSVNGLPPSNARKDLLRCGYGKGEDNLRQAILVFRVCILDVGFRFL
jgi:hypothetical protein